MDQNTMRQQQNHFSLAIIRPFKLPAVAVPAVLPVIVFCSFVLVAFHTLHGQTPQATEVRQLIEQMAQIDFDQRQAAEQRLIEIGSPAVDPLITTLLDCKPDVCARVKRILQAITRECDEDSLFRALAALRIRFEVPSQRIQLLSDRWAIQRREAVVAQWRQQGAIVNDALESVELENKLDGFENRLVFQRPQPQVFRFDVVIGENGKSKSQATEDSPEPKAPVEQVITQPIGERLQGVLDGSLAQNKQLVLNSKKGADGFEKSLSMLQQQPVSVTIGKDWRGKYSDFAITDAGSNLSIGGLVVQQKEINDSLLSVVSKHPLSFVTLDDCSIAAGVTGKLPASLKMLVIENSDDPAKMLDLVPRDSSALGLVRFVSSKFGKTQAVALKDFPQLSVIELEKIDLEKDAFDGLASLRKLRRVGIARCKFSAAEFLEFQKERGDVGVQFTAKAFLGVSSAPIGIPRSPIPGKGCVIATVVSGEAADRAGMKAGDQVLNIGEQKVNSFEELRIAIAQCEIGEEVLIKILRDGAEKTLKVKMGVPDDSR